MTMDQDREEPRFTEGARGTDAEETNQLLVVLRVTNLVAEAAIRASRLELTA